MPAVHNKISSYHQYTSSYCCMPSSDRLYSHAAYDRGMIAMEKGGRNCRGGKYNNHPPYASTLTSTDSISALLVYTTAIYITGV